MNDENLIDISSRPLDEQREIQRKGGIANGELRRRRKTQREYLQNALDMKVKTIPQLKKLGEKMGLDVDKATLQELLTIKLLLNTADKSDISSLKDVTALLGEQNETNENNGILNDLTAYLKGKNNAE
nr:MAG TPA: hypothetical protein [Caudoviricetes sp.]